MFSPKQVLEISEAYIEILETENQCLGASIDELAEFSKTATDDQLRSGIAKLLDLKNNLNGNASGFQEGSHLSIPKEVRCKTSSLRELRNEIALRSATLSEPTGETK